MLLRGIFPAIPTPFYADGRLYLKKLESNVERYSRSPISGLVLLGSTGESVMLDAPEQRELLCTAIEVAAPNLVMIAGCGHESVLDTLHACEDAAAFGYDAALVRTPQYYRAQMNASAMLNYYRMVADQSPLPILLYNVPQYTGYDLSAELIIELAEHPNIIGLEESTGDLAKVERIVQRTAHIRYQVPVSDDFQPITRRMAARSKISQTDELLAKLDGVASDVAPAKVETLQGRSKEVGFQILAGSGHKLEALLHAGAVGGMLAFAACAPMACYEIYTAYRNQDRQLAAEKQNHIEVACRRIVNELGIAAVKYAADLKGFYGGGTRLPLLPLTGAQRQEVEQLMADIPA